MARGPNQALQRVQSGPEDEFIKCENDIEDTDCTFQLK